MVVRSPGTAFGGGPSYGGNWGTTYSGGGSGGGSSGGGTTTQQTKAPDVEQPKQVTKSTPKYSTSYLQKLITQSGNRGKVTVSEIENNPAAVRQLEKKVARQYSDVKKLLVATGQYKASNDPEIIKAIEENPNALAQLKRKFRGYYQQADLSDKNSIAADIRNRQFKQQENVIASDILTNLQKGNRVSIGREKTYYRTESGQTVGIEEKPYYSVTETVNTPQVETGPTSPPPPWYSTEWVKQRVRDWETSYGGGLSGAWVKTSALAVGYTIRDVWETGSWVGKQYKRYKENPNEIINDSRKTIALALWPGIKIYQKQQQYIENPGQLWRDVSTLNKKAIVARTYIGLKANRATEKVIGGMVAFDKNPVQETRKTYYSLAYDFEAGKRTAPIFLAKGASFAIETYALNKGITGVTKLYGKGKSIVKGLAVNTFNKGKKTINIIAPKIKVEVKNTFEALKRSKKGVYGIKNITAKKSLKQRRPITNTQKSKISRGQAYNPNINYDIMTGQTVVKGSRPASYRGTLRKSPGTLISTLKQRGNPKSNVIKRIATLNLNTGETNLQIGFTREFRSKPGFRKLYPKGYTSQNRLLPSGQIIIDRGQYISIGKSPPKRLGLPNKNTLNSKYNLTNDKVSLLINNEEKIIPATILKETPTQVKGFRGGTFDKLMGRLRNLKEQRLNILNKQSKPVTVRPTTTPYSVRAYGYNPLDYITSSKASFTNVNLPEFSKSAFGDLGFLKRKKAAKILNIFEEQAFYYDNIDDVKKTGIFTNRLKSNKINIGFLGSDTTTGSASIVDTTKVIDVFNVGDKYQTTGSLINDAFKGDIGVRDVSIVGVISGSRKGYNYDYGNKINNMFKTETRYNYFSKNDLGLNLDSDSDIIQQVKQDQKTQQETITDFSKFKLTGGSSSRSKEKDDERIVIFKPWPDDFKPGEPVKKRPRPGRGEGIPKEEPPTKKITDFKLWEDKPLKKKKKQPVNDFFNFDTFKFPTLEGAFKGYKGKYPSIVTGTEIRPIIKGI